MCLRKIFGLDSNPKKPASPPPSNATGSALQGFVNGINHVNSGLIKFNNQLDYINYKLRLQSERTSELRTKKSQLLAQKLELVRSTDYSNPEKKHQVENRIELIDKELLEVESMILSVIKDCEAEAKIKFDQQ